MNIAEYSIKNSIITWLVIVIFTVGGVFAFNSLGRLEDPEYTIKDALVYTPYPGASSLEVEEEVTDKIETKIQELPYIEKITSKSYPGMSEITVSILKKYDKSKLPQIWDELRRKVNDVAKELPPGVLPSIVNDDYGDVYGIFYAITGDGYSYPELKEIAKNLRKQLILIPNVAKIAIAGDQQEEVYIEISNAKLSQLGISINDIYKAISSQNIVSKSGNVKINNEYIRINPTGEFASEKDIGDIVVNKTQNNKIIYLKDVAIIKRGIKEVPSHLIYYNGKEAITLGVSLISGGNIVTLGHDIQKRLQELQSTIPVGVKINEIYYQPKYVDESVSGFVISLVEAVLIVILILLLFMGFRSGLIIGGILLITILGTFVFMKIFDISLQRISLGALIIALGMLVDNAIVVAEGILIKIKQGENPIKSASEIVKQTIWPLFGATVVGIIAFAPIGLSSDSTGEYCKSLFVVILISLMLSWYLAITATPLFCAKYLKSENNNASKEIKKDPYDNLVFNLYKKFLILCIKFRFITVIIMIALLGLSVFGFSYVKQSFFPNATTPIFYLDYWKQQGTDIRDVANDMQKISNYIENLNEVESVTAFVGQGATRFMLTYTPEQANTSYGQFLIKVKNYFDIDIVASKVKSYVLSNYVDVELKDKYVMLGTGGDAKIEARFSGENPVVLRQLSNNAQDIMRKSNQAINIKDDWRQKVKVIRPKYSKERANRVGVTRENLKDALEMNFDGKNIGTYREKDELLPILIRTPDQERLSVDSIRDLFIWRDFDATKVPISQVTNGFDIVFEDQLVRRRNRQRTITAQSDPIHSKTADEVLGILMPQIEAIPLPPGYKLEWGGEYEDSKDAKDALNKSLPVGIFFMILIVILLFGKLRQPLIIWLTVPFSLIGVTAGLLFTGESFGFMALLGMLSLSGMLIKNAIVLIDEIDTQIATGKNKYAGIIDSSVSRVRPVGLAACTTVLGMIPLLHDAFFVSMAVTIMAGLSFATILTLIIVPVLYSIFFKIKPTIL